MTEFKRGDMVEALYGNQWKPAMYIGGSGFGFAGKVIFDDDDVLVHIANIRAPRKTVKVMMQDWLSDDPCNGLLMSREINIRPGMTWTKLGKPYEREFPV